MLFFSLFIFFILPTNPAWSFVGQLKLHFSNSRWQARCSGKYVVCFVQLTFETFWWNEGGWEYLGQSWSCECCLNRPVSSLGHQGGEEFSERGHNFLNYVQQHWTMSNKFLQGENFSRGAKHPCTTFSYGPVIAWK